MEFPIHAEFVTSSTSIRQCPAPVLPEYAFIGRSNVGKSSLINMITGKKVLARISSTPGKTQLINHFLINDKWYLVDLPGYGFAKTAKVNRRQWETMIEDYLIRRENLMSAFVLVDSRLEMQEIDRQVINWFGEHGIHFTLLFTKADKLSPNQLSSNLGRYKTELLKDWESLPPIILTSAKSRLGREEILQFITGTNQLFRLSDQDRS